MNPLMKTPQPEIEVPPYTIHSFFQKRTTYCVCVPVINENGRIKRQLEKMKHNSTIADIIIADGGSTDNSLQIDFLKKHGVKALLTKTGQGKLSAQMRMALDYAIKEGYDGFIFVDGNNKDDTNAIKLFIKELNNGYDHLQGSRFIKGGKSINIPFLRYILIRWVHAPLLSLAAGFWYTDTTNGFRAYSKRLILDNRVKPFRNVFSEYDLHYYLAIRAVELHFKVKEVPVTRAYPKEEVPSKIKGFHSYFRLFLNLINACLRSYNPSE